MSALPHAGLPRAAHVVRLKAAFDRKEFVSASSERLKRAVRAELELLLERAARPAPARAPAAPPARSSP